MNEKLLQISSRIKELRDILGISAQQIAEKAGIPCKTYLQYEEGKLDIPVSILSEIAVQLGTDLTVLLTGEAPRMDTHTIVRANKGIDVERLPGYHFQSLAFNFKNRDMEPLLVTLNDGDAPAPLVMHGGQEFNYVLEGCVRVTIGGKSYDLHPGDSIYFNPRAAHGQAAIGGTAKFLTVINEGKQ